MFDSLRALAWLEPLAVCLALAYLLLAARENILCWYCAFVSSLLYAFIFWDVNLPMDAGLSVFYVLMALVGWWQWTQGGRRHAGVVIHSWPVWVHGLCLLALLAAAALNAWLLELLYPQAARPFVDSFTTWASVFNTFLVVRKVLENWLWWVLIDGVYVWLYLDRGLALTALLNLAYVVIVVFGYLSWRRLYREGRAS